MWYLIDPIGNAYDITIERVRKGLICARRQWHIVNRGQASHSPEDGSWMYPDVIAGPFPSLKAAKAAYLLLI